MNSTIATPERTSKVPKLYTFSTITRRSRDSEARLLGSPSSTTPKHEQTPHIKKESDDIMMIDNIPLTTKPVNRRLFQPIAEPNRISHPTPRRKFSSMQTIKSEIPHQQDESQAAKVLTIRAGDIVLLDVSGEHNDNKTPNIKDLVLSPEIYAKERSTPRHQGQIQKLEDVKTVDDVLNLLFAASQSEMSGSETKFLHDAQQQIWCTSETLDVIRREKGEKVAEKWLKSAGVVLRALELSRRM